MPSGPQFNYHLIYLFYVTNCQSLGYNPLKLGWIKYILKHLFLYSVILMCNAKQGLMWLRGNQLTFKLAAGRGCWRFGRVEEETEHLEMKEMDSKVQTEDKHKCNAETSWWQKIVKLTLNIAFFMELGMNEENKYFLAYLFLKWHLNLKYF